ncbi:MAG: hypothetical protein AAF629_20910 [Chloroflexota bacterium]
MDHQNPQTKTTADILQNAYQQTNLLVLWGWQPVALAQYEPPNRATAINQWQKAVQAASGNKGASELLAQLPPLPILSLEPTTRLEMVFKQADIDCRIVLKQNDVVNRGGHSLIKLAGDLESRSGLVLSQTAIDDLTQLEDKRYLVTEAERIVNGGVLLLIGCDPSQAEFKAWWRLIASALNPKSIYGLGTTDDAWPNGVQRLDFDNIADLLWSVTANKVERPLNPQDKANLDKLNARLDRAAMITFCYDRFAPVYRRFEDDTDQAKALRLLLDYCKVQGQTEALLALVK